MTTNSEKLRAYKQGFVNIITDEGVDDTSANIIVDLAYKLSSDTQQRVMEQAEAHLPDPSHRIIFSSVAMKMLSEMATQSMELLERMSNNGIQDIVDKLIDEIIGGGSAEELDAELRAKGIVVNRETHAVIMHRQGDDNCDCDSCKRVAMLKADATIQHVQLDDGFTAYIVPNAVFEMHRAQAMGETVQ